MGRFKQTLGRQGEKIAWQFLRRRGYKIISKNFSCRLGEIDIIAASGRTTVFVEVKTRSSAEFGRPEESINSEKIRHLRRCARFYIEQHPAKTENWRFDVVAVILGNPTQIQLIKDAF